MGLPFPPFCQGLAIGLKLTLAGNNQLKKRGFWFFVVLVATSIATQMNYLNKALDTFNTAIVSPIYYVIFTTATIVASAILFNGWDSSLDDADINMEEVIASLRETGALPSAFGHQFGTSDLITLVCGFLTIVGGVFMLHISRQEDEAKKNAAAMTDDVATATAELLRIES